ETVSFSPPYGASRSVVSRRNLETLIYFRISRVVPCRGLEDFGYPPDFFLRIVKAQGQAHAVGGEGDAAHVYVVPAQLGRHLLVFAPFHGEGDDARHGAARRGRG